MIVRVLDFRDPDMDAAVRHRRSRRRPAPGARTGMPDALAARRRAWAPAAEPEPAPAVGRPSRTAFPGARPAIPDALVARRRARPPEPEPAIVRPRRRWPWSPAVGGAAPTIVQFAPLASGSSSNPTITLNRPSTAGNLILFFFAARASVASGPTGWGSPIVSAGLGPYIYSYAKANNAGGITTITGSLGGTARWVAWAYEIAGAPSVNPVEATGKTDTGGTPNGVDGTGTVNTLTANDLLLGGIAATATGTFSVSSGGFTIDGQGAFGAANVLSACALERTVSATGSYKAVTSGITSECGIVLAIPGAGGGVTGATVRFRKTLSSLWGKVGKRQPMGF